MRTSQSGTFCDGVFVFEIFVKLIFSAICFFFKKKAQLTANMSELSLIYVTELVLNYYWLEF